MKSFDNARTLEGVGSALIVWVVDSSSWVMASADGGEGVSLGLSISVIACRRLVPLSSIEWRNRRSSLHSWLSASTPPLK